MRGQGGAMRMFLSLLFWSISAASAIAAQQQTTTLYLDGALIEQAGATARGLVEINLPAAMQPGSLRVKPVAGAAIDRVELVPSGKPGAREAETARLMERREQLGDRLRALETREEIFKAAAKSQSGKAPRKTKTNPEPLATIRKGTDYALAQLEEVYRARRKAENELKDVTARLAARKEQSAGAAVARIYLKGKSGKIRVSYIRPDLKWLPRYDVRLDGSGEASVTLRARLPQEAQGSVFVLPALLSDPAVGTRVPVPGQTDAVVASFRTRVSQEDFLPGARSSVTFVLHNDTRGKLPEGNASCYWKGEYLGAAPLPALAPAESLKMAAGR